MSTVRTSSGHCQCGAVSYTVNGKLRPIIYCHCEQCRRTGGHFVAATACRPDQIEINGTENIKWYRSSPSAERGFCHNCGANLFWNPEHGKHWGIWAGSLDRPTGLKAVQHIYVHMKSDYYELDDGLPQYDEEYPSFEFEESE